MFYHLIRHHGTQYFNNFVFSRLWGGIRFYDMIIFNLLLTQIKQIFYTDYARGSIKTLQLSKLILQQ